MLVIYFFELSVRMKRHGFRFFVHNDDWAWNNLDFVIVMGGVFENWLLPIQRLTKNVVGKHSTSYSPDSGSLLPLLRMLRLLRILRLLRVLKNFKPLFHLSVGVLKAMQAIEWVLVLTIVLLYACAVLFTSLIGHGILGGPDVSSHARELFGSVVNSMFILFRIMNGDQTPMDPFLHSVQLKLLFVFFQVISNWMVLAILTAVVSENMICSTEEQARIEALDNSREKKKNDEKELTYLFKAQDTDQDGLIDEVQFQAMLRDEQVSHKLRSASGLGRGELEALFLYLSNVSDGNAQVEHKEFIKQLQEENKDVRERSMYRLERQIRFIETRIVTTLDSVKEELQRNDLINNQTLDVDVHLQTTQSHELGPFDLLPMPP